MVEWTIGDRTRELFHKSIGPLEAIVGIAGAVGGTYILGAEDVGPTRYALAPMAYLLAADLFVKGIETTLLWRGVYRSVHRNLETARGEENGG